MANNRAPLDSISLYFFVLLHFFGEPAPDPGATAKVRPRPRTLGRIAQAAGWNSGRWRPGRRSAGRGDFIDGRRDGTISPTGRAREGTLQVGMSDRQHDFELPG